MTAELAVIEVNAKIFPAKFVAVPRVAELPTWKKTLQERAPLISTTEAPVAVIRVEPVLKRNMLSGLF